MGRRVAIVGGRLDGGEAARPPLLVAWVDASGRCWRSPGPGRELHLRFGEALRWVHLLRVVCPGCSAIHERRDEDGEPVARCTMCGAALPGVGEIAQG